MVHALGVSSPTFQQYEGLPLDNRDATMLPEDAETLLVEKLTPLSPINTSDDQDMQELPSESKPDKIYLSTMANRRHIYRRKQKRKRQELRSQLAALNEELARLRDAKESEKALFNATQTPTFWFWKSVATRQRYERSLAEEEQRALTMSVHSQAAYIQTLTKVAGMPEKTPLAVTKEDQGVIGHKEQRCGPSETELFHAFIQDLDAKRKHVDELFQAYRSKPQFQDYRSKPQFDVRKADGKLEYSQLYITETIPFSLSQTSHSLWKLGIDHRSNYPGFKRCTDIPDPENTSARSFRSAIALENGVEISLQNRLVLRRYARGCIFAWKLVSEGVEIHNGFQFDESGWIFLRGSDLWTVIEICIQRSPMHFTSAMPGDRERFEQALQQLLDKARGDVFAVLHKVLIDDVLEHIDVSDIK